MNLRNRFKYRETRKNLDFLPFLFQGVAGLVLVGLAAILVVGCGALNQQVHLPPVADADNAKTEDGQFVWIDLLTEDTVTAASFYNRLFGWRAGKSNENGEYYLFSIDGKPVAGMTAMESKDAAASESFWLATISVSDVDRSVATAKAHGGQLLEGPLDAAGRGRMALIGDAADAPMILLAAGGRGPAGSNALPGQWLWVDLVTRDANRAQDFYNALFGYEATPMEAGEEHRYILLKREGRAVAGLVELDWEGLKDNWLPYFRVADVDQAIEAARNLGGSLVMKSGNVAVLADPVGAAFGIQAP
jgi:predicted enzyme related to lactoylglutathione lyase